MEEQGIGKPLPNDLGDGLVPFQAGCGGWGVVSGLGGEVIWGTHHPFSPLHPLHDPFSPPVA